MSDDEEDNNMCPLCVEEMDLSDKNFLPCPCGYRVCMWCWHHIRENLNGLCPACRTPYNADPHAFSAVDRQEIVKKNRERKQKEKTEKKVSERPSIGGAIKPSTSVDRLPNSASGEELLRKPEYFGQYGKISKVVVHRNPSLSHSTVSAYVTFAFKEDAKAAIQALDGFWLEGHPLRASFGTTKYCNNFIRNIACNNPECVYLHDFGDDDDRFTKEEIQSGHTKFAPVPGKDQTIVTGCGGPSGTGKRPAAETILPSPVFIQDNSALAKPIQLTRSSSFPSNSNAQAETKDAIIASDTQVSSQTSGTPQKSETSKAENSSDVENLHRKNIVEDSEPNFSESKSPQDSSDSHELNSNELGSPSNPPSATSSKLEEATQTLSDKQHVQTFESTMSSGSVSMRIEQFTSEAFNGVTGNALFPVPASSLSFTVWSIVAKESDVSLIMNPFGKLTLSLSDLLDLTLPPVDAISLPSKNNYMLVTTRQNEQEQNNDGKLSQINGRIQNHSHSGIEATNDAIGLKGGPNPTISALKQLFPGVNLSYGAIPSASR